MIQISKQLHNPDFRFVLLKPKSKIPFENEWQNKGYRFDDPKLLKHIEKGGNYGVIGGYGNLRILDIDDKKLGEEFEKKIETFTVKTGSGGRHFYFISEYKTNHVLKDGLGELRAHNYQVVGSGCVHPNGNSYQLIKDEKIKALTVGQLKKIINPYLKKESSDKSNLEVLRVDGKDVSRSGKEWREILKLVKKGLTDKAIDEEMQQFSKWVNSKGTYDDEKSYKGKTLNKARLQVKKLQDTKEQRREILKTKLDKSPIYYDTHGIFWIWKDNKWNLSDDIDVLVFLNDKLGVDTITPQSKNAILNSVKQHGRRNKPESLPEHSICFKNCIYDLKNQKEIPISSKYFITSPIPYNLTASNETPIIDQLFVEWVGEKHKTTLFEILAYSTLDEQFLQTIFALTGAGSNGKGTYQNLIRKFLGGENVVSSSIKSLITRNFETSALYKKKLCVIGEVDGNDLSNTNIIKQFTGEDLIRYEFKGKTPFSEESPTTFIIATNSLPTTPDKSIGFYRRWVIVDFPNQFKINRKLLEQIPEQEYENLCRKVVETASKLMKTETITHGGGVEERRDRYEERSNPIAQFIKKYCTEEGGNFVKLKEFTDILNSFLKRNKLRPKSIVEVGKSLRYEGFDISPRDFIVDRSKAKAVLGLAFHNDIYTIYEKTVVSVVLQKLPELPEFNTWWKYYNNKVDLETIKLLKLPLFTTLYKNPFFAKEVKV